MRISACFFAFCVVSPTISCSISKHFISFLQCKVACCLVFIIAMGVLCVSHKNLRRLFGYGTPSLESTVSLHGLPLPIDLFIFTVQYKDRVLLSLAISLCFSFTINYCTVLYCMLSCFHILSQ